jgi:Tol biopolymer transport system component
MDIIHSMIKKLLLFFLIAGSCSAQFVDFGRNKVQYSDFEWHILSTEHFRIYYYKEEKELAEQGAYFAEESYKFLQQKFNHSLTDTVPVIFYASPTHFKETNTTPGLIPDGVGGFFEFIKGRVVLPHEGSLGQFKHVIRHELTHVFMTSKIASDLRIHGLSPDKAPPLWFTEGLAEYYSSNWESQGDMVLKDAVLHKYIVGLDNWEEFYGTYFMYKLGQKVLEYIGNKFGEEKVLKLVENSWIDENFENVMKLTIGMNYKTFDKEFLPWLKEQYNNEIKNKQKVAKSTKNIQFDGFAMQPAWTHSSGKDEIYFIGNQTGYTSVYKTGLEGDKNTELIVKGEASDEFEQFHFFRTGLDISENGKLAFATQKGGEDALHIFDIKADEKNADYQFKNIVGIGKPSWSSDGKTVVFSANEWTGKSDIYIFDTGTQKLKRLTNDYYDDREPDISPGNKYIVFSSDRTSYGKKGWYNLFLYDIASGDIKELTNGAENDITPEFSVDGKRIVYASNKGRGQNLFILEMKDSAFSSLQLTDFDVTVSDPRWAGNDRIVFSSFENKKMKLRILDNVNHRIDSLRSDSKPVTLARQETIWEPGKIDTGLSRHSIRYKKDFSLDLATTSLTTDPVFGTNSGGIVSVSDLLGNEKYYFLVYNNSGEETDFWKSFNIAVSKVSLEKRLNYAYGVYHLSGKRYDLQDENLFYFERVYGGYLSFSYPLSGFRRLESSTSLSQSVKEVDITENTRSLLLSNSVSYVKDNVIWWWTGPIDGERLNLTLGYTTDVQNSNLSYYSVLFDYRKYIRLSNPLTLALRGQFFMNEGKSPRRFFQGGSWSLRGWDRFSIRGSKMWEANAELRFPILNNTGIKLSFLQIDIPSVKGALFFDAGNAWDTKANYGFTKGSIGAGIRANILGAIVLRYDVGKRILDNFKRLEDRWFTQFYFGWDF